MKGKGKGGGDKTEKDKGGNSDSKELSLQFPDMKPLDHVRLCPRYAAGENTWVKTSGSA